MPKRWLKEFQLLVATLYLIVTEWNEYGESKRTIADSYAKQMPVKGVALILGHQNEIKIPTSRGIQADRQARWYIYFIPRP